MNKKKISISALVLIILLILIPSAQAYIDFKINGNVFTGNYQGVAGANVTVDWKNQTGANMSLSATTVEGDFGRFYFVIPIEDYTVGEIYTVTMEKNGNIMTHQNNFSSEWGELVEFWIPGAYTISGNIYTGNKIPITGLTVTLSYKDANGTNQTPQSVSDQNGSFSFTVDSYNIGDTYNISTSDTRFKFTGKFDARMTRTITHSFSDNVLINYSAPAIVTRGKKFNVTMLMNINNAEEISGLQFNIKMKNTSRMNVTNVTWNQSFYKKSNLSFIEEFILSYSTNSSYNISNMSLLVYSNSGNLINDTIANNFAVLLGPTAILNGTFNIATQTVIAEENYSCKSDKYIDLTGVLIASSDSLPVGYGFGDNELITVTSEGDLNGDLVQNVVDTATLVNYWNKAMTYPCSAANHWCRADINNDNAVNIFDLVRFVNSAPPTKKLC